MGSAAEVPVEISSDEEDDAQAPATGKRKSPDAAALAWAEAILDQEDSDDAVLEREGCPATMQEFFDSLKAVTGIAVGDEDVVGAKNTTTVPDASGDAKGMSTVPDTRGDDDDDDCVMLDGDPDKPVAVAKAEDAPPCDAADDELQIVAEKGEVACRDFPHPRHLCATLPFSTSSHASHCSMCHCYVCDCPAPCPLWDHHCHATDKDSKWKRLRQSKNKSELNPKRRIPQHFNQSVTTGPSTQYLAGFTGMPRTIPSYGSTGAQVAPPLYTSSNGNHLQPSVHSYGMVQPARPHASQPTQVSSGGHVGAETFQRYPLQFPVGAPMGYQGHQYRSPSYPQLAPNTVVGTGVPLSRCSSLNTQAQGTQRPQVPSPDILTKKVLANLARQLGLSDYNTNQPLGQQSTSTPHYTHMHPRDILHAEGARKDRRLPYVKTSYVAVTSQIGASSGHNSSNHAPGTVVSSSSVQIRQPLCQLKPSTVVSSGSVQIQQPLCQLKPGTVVSSGSVQIQQPLCQLKSQGTVLSSGSVQMQQPLCQLKSQSSVTLSGTAPYTRYLPQP